MNGIILDTALAYTADQDINELVIIADQRYFIMSMLFYPSYISAPP